MRHCPRCREDLANMTFDDISVDGCGRCGGVWFDRGELMRLAGGGTAHLEAIDRAFEARPGVAGSTEGAGPCPACSASMVRFQPAHLPQLTLTGCPSGHGTWLKEDDFERIEARLGEWQACQPGPQGSSTTPLRQRPREVAQLLLSRPCPQCGQPNSVACPICWACGAALMASSRFACPRCRAGLANITFEGIILSHCVSCGGLWLDHGELGALLQLQRELLLRLQRQLEPPSPRLSASRPDPAPCPACRTGMQYDEYGANSGVFIFSCDNCRGLWLNYSALVPIQLFALARELSQ